MRALARAGPGARPTAARSPPRARCESPPRAPATSYPSARSWPRRRSTSSSNAAECSRGASTGPAVGRRRRRPAGSLADVPVLAVRHVPELDRIARDRSPARRACRDGRATRRRSASGPAQRPERVHHHVVGVEAQQHVREDRVIVDALRSSAGRSPTGVRTACRSSQRRRAVAERHVAAEERAVAQVVSPLVEGDSRSSAGWIGGQW